VTKGFFGKTILIAILAAVLLAFTGGAAGAANQYTTLTILRHNPGVSGAQLDDFVRHVHPESPLLPENNGGTSVGQLWVNAGLSNNIDPVYLMAHAMVESAWGNDQIAPYNIYGYGAYDSDPVGGAYHFTSYQDCIDKVSYWISRDYLTPGGGYYTQYGPTLQGMNVNYATSQTWRYTIADIMNSFASGWSSYGWPGFSNYPFPPTYGDYDATYKLIESRTINDASPEVFEARQTYELVVQVTNYGQFGWNAGGANPFYLGYYWTQNGAMVGAGNAAAWLPSDLYPGQTAFLKARVTAPQGSGNYKLVFDMSRQGILWFSHRWIPTLSIPSSVTKTHYDQTKFGAATSGDIALVDGSPAIFHFRPGTLIKGPAPDTTIYVTEFRGGIYFKRAFNNMTDFNTLGYHMEDLVYLSAADLGAYTTGSAVSTAAHPSGSLVKTASLSTIYFIEDSAGGALKRAIASATVFEANGFRWDRIETISDSEMANMYTAGNPVYLPSGKVIKGGGSSIYVVDIDSGAPQRRAVTSASVFTALGFRWEDVLTVSDAYLATYTEGTPVSSSATHPNGAIVKNAADPDSVYLIENGYKRKLGKYLYTDPYVSAFVSGFESSELTTVVKGSTINLPVTLKNNGYLPWPAAATSLSYQWIEVWSGTVTNGTTTAIGSDLQSGASATLTASVVAPAATGAYVLKWDVLKDGGWLSASGSPAAYYATTTARPKYPDGRLVKTASAPDVYLIDQGKKRPVTSGTVFSSNGFRWDRIHTVTATELAQYTTGELCQARPGTLIKGSSPAVYISDFSGGDQTKRAIGSAAVFTSLGLRWEDVRQLSDVEVASYINGPSLDSAAKHPNGMLVKTAGDPAVFLLEAGAKRAVASAATFNSNALRWDRVVTISTAEMNGYALGPTLQAAPGALIKGSSSTVYVSDINAGGTYEKRPINSITAFYALGLNFADLYVVPDSELGGYGNGAALE